MKGSYMLFLRCKKNCKISVGRLGKLKFKKGIYIYVGSGMNNLEKRVKRHFLKRKKIRWHIDYITTNRNFEVEFAILIPSKKRLECYLSKLLSQKLDYVKGFGSTDCKCKSHLYILK